MRKTDFTKALTEYFSIYLPTTCGVSPNTTNSYRDTFKQLLLFFQEKKGISANYIELRYLNMELVSEFLDWLETSRHIAVTTRNQRLAAIKAFAHFVQYKFPENIENCVDIINLRPKKYEKALIPFLTEDDLSLLLSQPDASTRQGLRDLTLLYRPYAAADETLRRNVPRSAVVFPAGQHPVCGTHHAGRIYPRYGSAAERKRKLRKIRRKHL